MRNKQSKLAMNAKFGAQQAARKCCPYFNEFLTLQCLHMLKLIAGGPPPNLTEIRN